MNPTKPEDTPEDAQQLEATRRKLERLTKLHRDVASGLLEVSEAARRDAERLLSADAGTTESGGSADETPPAASEEEPARVWSNPFLYGSFAFGLLCGFLLALVFRTPEVSQIDEMAAVDQSSPETAFTTDQPEVAEPTPSIDSVGAPSPAETAQPPVAPTAGAETPTGLVLTLRTHRACWLSVRVDDGDPVERLLPPNETVVLQVEDEAALRIGDAAALSLLINDQPTRLLGSDGQVVELRITPSNFRTFLNGH